MTVAARSCYRRNLSSRDKSRPMFQYLGIRATDLGMEKCGLCIYIVDGSIAWLYFFSGEYALKLNSLEWRTVALENRHCIHSIEILSRREANYLTVLWNVYCFSNA